MLSKSPTLRLTREALKLDEADPSLERDGPGEASVGGVLRSVFEELRLRARIRIASGPRSNEESVCMFFPIWGPWYGVASGYELFLLSEK